MRISDWSSDVCSSDLFDGEFQVLSWRPVGTQHLKLELGLPGVRLQAIEFGGWTGTPPASRVRRSEEHTSELQSLMRISYAVFCLKKKNIAEQNTDTSEQQHNTR